MAAICLRRMLAGMVLAAGLMAGSAAGQVVVVPQPIVSGVAINAEGVISHRAEDPGNRLEEMRRRMKTADAAKAPGELKCVSLPKVFGQAKELLAAGKALPEDLKYLGGLTRVDYVFVYPEEKELLIAGPAEEWVGGETLEPVGKATGRPVMQFFDLVAVMRTLNTPGRGGGEFFGCSIDMPENSKQISDDVAKKYSGRPAAEIVKAMGKAMGPQKVRVIGTADNTRLAFVMVAADYKLKRFTMGLEMTPVTGLGNAVDDSHGNGCRFWFEPLFEPLTVSADGRAYGISGSRLQVKAGLKEFDTSGVTEKAKAFAERFNGKLPELVKAEPGLADLQNIADLALVAALVKQDRLDRKVEWDEAWCMDANACPVPTVPALRSCETVAAVVGNAVASGGVAFVMNHWVGKDGRVAAQAGAMPAAPKVSNSWQMPMAAPPTGAKP